MKTFLEYKLIEIGDFIIRVSNIAGIALLILFSMLLLWLIRKGINRFGKFDEAKKYAIYHLVKYLVLVISIVLSLQVLGLNISVLLAGSAALLVGIGLGLQGLFSDFISGIILLVDSTVKVHDVIELNGMICRVREINLRTTTVMGRDGNFIIIPNTELTKNMLINWTHSKVSSRFNVNVGVDYASDVKLVMKVLKDIGMNHNAVMKKPEPQVRFADYGDSSLNFSLFFWTEEVFRVENIKSELRVKIFEAFQENGINIPFPQRVIHFKNGE